MLNKSTDTVSIKSCFTSKIIYTAFVLICILLLVLSTSSFFEVLISGASYIKDIVSVLICLLCLSIIALTRGDGIPITPTAVIAMLWIIIVVINTIFYARLNAIETVIQLKYRVMYSAVMLLFFLVSVGRVNNYKRILERIILISFVVGVLTAILAIIELMYPARFYQIFSNAENMESMKHTHIISGGQRLHRLRSITGNPITCGFVMLLSICAALYMISNGKKRYIYICGLVLFSVVLMLTYSRAAYAGTVAAVLIYLLNATSKQGTNSRGKSVLLIGVFVIGISLLLASDTGLSSRIETISYDTYVNNARVTRAIDNIKELDGVFQIMFGIGVGNNRNMIRESQAFVFEFGYASILYECGVVCLLIWIFLQFRGIYCGIKIIKHTTQRDDRNIAIYMLSVMFAILVIMFVEDSHLQQPLNLYMWMCCFFSEYIYRGLTCGTKGLDALKKTFA